MNIYSNPKDVEFVVNKLKELVQQYRERLETAENMIKYQQSVIKMQQTDTEQPGIYVDKKV